MMHGFADTFKLQATGRRQRRREAVSLGRSNPDESISLSFLWKWALFAGELKIIVILLASHLGLSTSFTD